MRLRSSLVTLAGALGVLVCLALPYVVVPAQAQPSIGGAFSGAGADRCYGKACAVLSLTSTGAVTSSAADGAAAFALTNNGAKVCINAACTNYIRNRPESGGTQTQYVAGAQGHHFEQGISTAGGVTTGTGVGTFSANGVASGSNAFNIGINGARYNHGTGADDWTDSDGADVRTGGGLGLNVAGGARPACNVGNRGKLWFTRSAAGVADVTEVCRKDAADAYGWVAL